MLLVQKIFYFHVPSWFVMFSGAFLCAGASVRYLAKGSREADHYAVTGAELAVVFGLIGLITGPLWARKAWGVWWEWDVKLTLALVVWLTFVAYLLLRRYGGPGLGEAGGRRRHLRRGQHPVRVLLGQLVADHPPEDQRGADAAGRACAGTFWFCVAGVHAADGADRRRARAAGAAARAGRRPVSGVWRIEMRAAAVPDGAPSCCWMLLAAGPVAGARHARRATAAAQASGPGRVRADRSAAAAGAAAGGAAADRRLLGRLGRWWPATCSRSGGAWARRARHRRVGRRMQQRRPPVA